MYELIQVGENSFYIDCPSKIGIVKISESEICLIDSGNDKDAAKKVRQIIEQHSWTLSAIYNTHSHADHIGGNQYLQKQTGCKIYAPGLEREFTAHPILEPMLLYGGNPPKELHSKFLMAKESEVEPLTENALADDIEMIPLPGHSFDMTGFRTKDNAVYLADCLSSAEVLEKYQIGFIYNVAEYVETLEKVKTMQADMFIPSHAEATSDIAPLAQLNIDKVYEIADRITNMCSEPLSFEDILEKLFTCYSLKMTMQQYALIGCTVRSYLSWLKSAEKLEILFENNRMLWRTVR